MKISLSQHCSHRPTLGSRVVVKHPKRITLRSQTKPRRLLCQSNSPNNTDPETTPTTLRLIDEILDQQEQQLLKDEASLADLERQIKEVTDEGWPTIVLKIYKFFYNIALKAKDNRAETLRKLRIQRAELAAELEALNNEQPLEPVIDFSDPEALMNEIEEMMKTDPAADAIGIAFAAALSCLVVTWVASFQGIEAGALLNNPRSSLTDLETISKWAAFTLPYLGATAAFALAAPQLASNRALLRNFHSKELFTDVNFSSLASLAVAVGYSRTVIWQGAFLNTFTAALGGDVAQQAIDPNLGLQDEVVSSLGSLVMTQRLPLILLIPSVVVSVAACEAGFFWVNEYLSQKQSDTLSDFIYQSDLMPDPNASEEELKQIQTMKDMGPLLKKQFNQGREAMTEDELAVSAGRIALASAWLSTETLVTENLWLAVGTSVLGLLLAMGLAGKSAKEQ